MLLRKWKPDHSYIAGVSVKCSGILESSLMVFYKTKYAITIQPSNYTLGNISQRNENFYLHQHLYTTWLLIAALSVIVKIRLLFNGWMVKQTGYPYHRIIFSIKKNEILIHKTGGWSPGSYDDWQKSPKDYKLYYSIYIIFFKWENYRNENETSVFHEMGKGVVTIKDDQRHPCGGEIIQYFDCINFNILFNRW